jgi:acyl carrier protein
MTAENEQRKDILERIQLIVREVVGDRDLVLTERTTAGEVLGWDSLTHVQIIIGIEQAFGIRMSTTEVAQLEDSGSLIDVVLKHQATDAGGQ